MSTALPELSDLFNQVLQRTVGRPPRDRQWHTPGGWIIGWTTERFGTGPGYGGHRGPSGTGKFGAFAYRPEGKGARTGQATTFRLSRYVYRKARWRAKRKAFEWYLAQLRREAASGKPFAAKAQRELGRWQGWEVAQGGAFRRRTEPSTE